MARLLPLILLTDRVGDELRECAGVEHGDDRVDEAYAIVTAWVVGVFEGPAIADKRAVRLEDALMIVES